jgi:AcrR family transcriptional regulator
MLTFPTFSHIMESMKTLSPKKREIIRRESRVLELARGILLKRGYHGLTMARIAKAAGCSKATVYQHFPCKEEIIVALATESVEIQRSLVDRAATFQGRPRERMVAVGIATQLYAELYAEDSRIFQIVNGEAILQKASERTIWRLRSSGLRTVNVMLGIVRDAMAQGDLKLQEGHSAEDIIYHFWLLGEGGKASPHMWLPPEEFSIKNPFESIINTSLTLADGYGWKPLSSEWDYTETTDRVWREVFPAERRKVFGENESTPGVGTGQDSTISIADSGNVGRPREEVMQGR